MVFVLYKPFGLLLLFSGYLQKYLNRGYNFDKIWVKLARRDISLEDVRSKL